MVFFGIIGSEGLITSGNIKFSKWDKWHGPTAEQIPLQNDLFEIGYDKQLLLHQEYFINPPQIIPPQDSAEAL